MALLAGSEAFDRIKDAAIRKDIERIARDGPDRSRRDAWLSRACAAVAYAHMTGKQIEVPDFTQETQDDEPNR